jgi:hypothetical protein
VNIRLLLFFLNTYLWAQAQYPGGYAQYFNLTKAQNISGSYWSDINQAKDGSIIIKPYPGNYVRFATYHNQTIYVGSTLRDINLYNVLGYDKQGEIYYETTGNSFVWQKTACNWTPPNQSGNGLIGICLKKVVWFVAYRA